jgi:hypothetical protein
LPEDQAIFDTAASWQVEEVKIRLSMFKFKPIISSSAIKCEIYQRWDGVMCVDKIHAGTSGRSTFVLHNLDENKSFDAHAWRYF